jgi:uncharacterized phage protein gp47/JayE
MREIPTLEEIKDTIANDLKTKLNLSDSNLKYVLNAMDSVLAAQFKLVYLYLSDVQNNIFPDTADIEANGGTLERLGRIYLNRNPRPATNGIFKVSLTGTAGGFLRSGLTFKSNENSKNPSQLFVLDADYTMTGTGDEIEIRSLGSGTSFDLDLNDELTITEPVIGVNNLVTVIEIIEQPIATEDIEVYRQNILDAIQLEPQGGSRTDYRLWSNDAQGVRKVYPYVKNGESGTVQVFVEATIENSTDGDGTPSLSLLEDVEDVIFFDPDETKPLNERGRIPIQANLEVLPISKQPVDVEIIGLNDNSSDVLTAISENLNTYLRDIRPYISGADLPRSKNDILYSGRLQSVVTDVLSSSNFFTGFVMKVDGVVVNSYEFELGFIPYLRDVTYV